MSVEVETKVFLPAVDPNDLYASPVLEFSSVDDPNETLIQIQVVDSDPEIVFQVNAEALKELLRRIDIILARG